MFASALAAAARSAVSEMLAEMYCGWSDAAIAAEPGGAEFLALRSAVAAASPDWSALADRFVAGEFRGWSESELAETAPAFLAARSALRRLAL